MKIPFIDWVQTNIKCGADTKLGPKTIIIGGNGSGKSTIVDAITLALTGTVDAVAFKDAVKQEVALMALKNHEVDDEEPLLAEVTAKLADGSSRGAQWAAFGSRESAKSAEWKNSVPVGKSPMILGSLRSTLATAGVDRLRELFISAVEDFVSDDDVTARLTGEAKEFFNDVNHNQHEDVPGGAGPSTMDTLSIAIDQADSEKRAASAAIKTLEASQGRMGKLPTDAELKELEAGAKQAKADFEAAVKVLGKFEAVQEMASAAVHPTTTALATVLDEVVKRGTGSTATCPLCLTEAQLDVIKTRQKKINDMIAAAKPKPKIKSPAVIEAEKVVEKARNALEGAELQLDDLQALKEEYEAADQNREALDKAKVDVDKFKRILDALKAARDGLIQSGAETLEKKVQSFLPSAYKFRLVLNYGDRRVCLIGFERANSIDVALSAGESCLVLIALASALAVDPEKNVHVAVPPDCSMSPATLTALMEATANAPVQIIITTTTEPSKVPAGWTRVRTPL